MSATEGMPSVESAAARLLRAGDPSSSTNKKLMAAAHVLASDLINRLMAAAQEKGPLNADRDAYILFGEWVLVREEESDPYLAYCDSAGRLEYWFGGKELRFNEETLDEAIWFSRHLVENKGYGAWSQKCIDEFLNFATNWEHY